MITISSDNGLLAEALVCVFGVGGKREVDIAGGRVNRDAAPLQDFDQRSALFLIASGGGLGLLSRDGDKGNKEGDEEDERAGTHDEKEVGVGGVWGNENMGTSKVLRRVGSVRKGMDRVRDREEKECETTVGSL